MLFWPVRTSFLYARTSLSFSAFILVSSSSEYNILQHFIGFPSSSLL
eukprot:02352.XXX_10681_10821_1 [CDS] Oithona nana genome sequencing.